MTVDSTNQRLEQSPGAGAPTREGGGRLLRPEIQALRAVAVTVVVLFHLWPEVLTGGFVGVDVFFVISGFLITDHLLREVDRSGRIRLAGFWARRARRLLPASLLVLLISAIGVLLWVPQVFWMQFFREATASALYVENWVLAADSVDYLAANNIATAAQHYWSLSVEEQFYLVWPLLILAAVWAAHRFHGRLDRRRTIAWTLGAVTASSLAYSVIATAISPASAYFVTPTRVWEFGLGGLLACIAAVPPTRLVAIRIAVAWLGWAAIAFASVTFSAATAFPGAAALIPVLGTVAVIWAGAPHARLAPSWLASLRPVQWVGDISYSMYLWHWPLIVIAPFVIGQAQLSIVFKAPLLLLTIVLAWATKRWVEDPVRTGALAVRPPKWTFAAAVAGMALVVIPSLVGIAAMQERIARDDVERARVASSPCFGAASLDASVDCQDAQFDVISPDPALAPQDSPDIYFTDPPCFADGSHVRSCGFGDPESSTRVALVGDSHAAQWQPALQQLAEEHGWYLELYLKTNCALTEAQRGSAYDACAQWSGEVEATLADREPFDLVLTSFFAENLGVEIDAGTLTRDEAIAGFQQAWRPLIDRGAAVIAIGDTPHMRQATTVCVATSRGSFDECSIPRAEAFTREDLQVTAAQSTEGAVSLDMSDHICAPTRCDAVVGGVALYTDPYHLTETYSRTLTPFLASGLASALDGSAVDGSLLAELRTVG